MKTKDPGLVVLSSSAQLLHMNYQAVQLLRSFKGGPVTRRTQLNAETVLPQELMDLFRDILRLCHQRLKTHDMTQFEIKRIVRSQEETMALRGFGLPGRTAQDQTRVVITIQRLHTPDPEPTPLPMSA